MLLEGHITDFPAGNMCWARTSAVYQISNEKVIEKTPEKKAKLMELCFMQLKEYGLNLLN